MPAMECLGSLVFGPEPARLMAAAGELLLGLYWISLILGGGLLLFSVLGWLGHGGDLDVDSGGVDLHTDSADGGDLQVESDAGGLHGEADAGHVDGGGHAAGTLSTWISVRFIVFFLASFGAVGVVLTYFQDLGVTPVAIAAVLAGVGCGQAVHQFFRYVRRTSGDSTPQLVDYVNRLGRVTVGIQGRSTGEVVVQVRGGERYLPAVACGPQQTFATGEEVVVVSYRGGVAEVVTRAEFESARRAQGA